MAANHLQTNNMAKSNGTQETTINLPLQPSDNDWTRAIHHKLNIKRRTCTTFIPKLEGTTDPNLNNVKCGCKRLRREHSWDVLQATTTTKWDKNQHTVAAYNNAYGFIPQTRAKYIRCDIQTDPKILAKG